MSRRMLVTTLLRLLCVVAVTVGVAGSAIAQRRTATLNVSSTPVTGVTVTANPADENGVGSGVTNFSLTYNTTVTIPRVVVTAPLNFNGEVFANWTINGSRRGPVATQSLWSCLPTSMRWRSTTRRMWPLQ